MSRLYLIFDEVGPEANEPGSTAEAIGRWPHAHQPKVKDAGPA